MKTYSLSKSRSLLKSGYKGYQKNYQNLSPDQKISLKTLLDKLQQAIFNGNKEEANALSQQLEVEGKPILKKSIFDSVSEFVIVIVVAVLIATLIRQMVFEAYEIPTGSMRPTFREQDNVLVSKTPFGINTPFSTSHLYFDPSLVQRTGIVIFSGDNIDLPDTDSHYLWIFPYKKRYIKRCMALPGDTVYFYGGKLYGMDKEQKDLDVYREGPWMENLDYIPYFHMEGIVSRPKRNEFLFNQMHQAVGRMMILPSNQVRGEVFNGKDWIEDDPQAALTTHDQIKTYSDFWGFRNYATSRLLNKQQFTERKGPNDQELPEALLYLEMRHTPHLSSANALFQQSQIGIKPIISAYTTTIPLTEKHIDALMNNMYTARFVVRDGKASRYNYEASRFGNDNPLMPNVPNGTYEFYHGKAYQIGFASIAYELSKDHPLYSRDPAHVQLLYNLGIEMSTYYEPRLNSVVYPSRYTYFREGNLHTMGGALFSKEDPILINFNKNEEQRQQQSSKYLPYIAFKDYGPPLKQDGSLDTEFLSVFGLKIPDGHYLTLGDNHAMSADSRIFGFVPEANLQGAPTMIVWPPGHRWGCPPQKPYHWFNLSTFIVWGSLAIIALIWYVIYRYRLKQPVLK